MKPKDNYIYKIKDSFFEEFPDPNLKYNKEGNRPHYFAFKSEKNDKLYWMIPMSTKTDKLENTIEKRDKIGKRTDFGYVCTVGGKKSAFMIGNMFPVTKDYLLDEYKMKGQPLKVLRSEDIKAIQQKAERIYTLIKNGKQFTPYQVNALSIEKILMKKLKREHQRKQFIQQQKDKRER